jgi:hypothetical protein
MGLLNFLGKSSASSLLRLPSGSFTVDPAGKVITSTIPQSFPDHYLKDVGAAVLEIFRSAQAAHAPLTDLVVQYSGLKITARELRGGAIIFLMPRTLADK